jgi:hypothetical protein
VAAEAPAVLLLAVAFWDSQSISRWQVAPPQSALTAEIFLSPHPPLQSLVVVHVTQSYLKLQLG